MDPKPDGIIAENVSDGSDTISTIVIEDDPKQKAETIQKLEVIFMANRHLQSKWSGADIVKAALALFMNGLTIKMLIMIIICVILIVMGFCVAAIYGEVKIAKNEKNMEVKITKLKEENGQLKDKFKSKMRIFSKQIKKLNILTERIDGNEFVKYNSNEYKLNVDDCGPILNITDTGFTVEYIGNDSREVFYYESNSVRAILPIPKINLTIIKPSIAFYFEMQIISRDHAISIGFSTRQFPLEGNELGKVDNTIGIKRKGGIWIDGNDTKLENSEYFDEYFDVGDVVGIGIIPSPANSQLNCFVTLNGELMGMAELPVKFATLQLFPSVTLFGYGDSTRVNFSSEEWHFKHFNQLLHSIEK